MTTNDTNENNMIDKKNNILTLINKSIELLCVVFLCSCVATKTQKIYEENQSAFKQKITSFIGKTPNELYAVLGKPNEYTTDVNTDKQIKNDNIIYKKVYNFHLKQYDCLITFKTDKTQKNIVDVKYNSDKCYYLAQYK